MNTFLPDVDAVDGLHVVVSGGVLHGLAAHVAEKVPPLVHVRALLLAPLCWRTNLRNVKITKCQILGAGKMWNDS